MKLGALLKWLVVLIKENVLERMAEEVFQRLQNLLKSPKYISTRG
jgi:hypothetical protein